ncbi:MAG: carboxylate--amine ligase [Thermodesulfobacteriota bacterium]
MVKALAVVIKLDSITGLQSARILSGYGIPVIGIVDDPSHFCSRTNCCEEILAGSTSGDALLETLSDIAGRRGICALFPCSDESVRVISRNRESLREHFRFVLPDEHVIDLFMNKSNFYKFALDRGFAIPSTCFPARREDLGEIAGKLKPPYIVKPAKKTGRWVELFQKKVLKLGSIGELDRVFDACLDAAGDIVVQERIEGDDSRLYSCIFYYDSRCEPYITFTSRKLRQWRIEDGDACLAEECRDDEVLKQTMELIGAVKFRGLGSLEFKKDGPDGRYHMIELNAGRPVTRIGLVEKAGVPILYAMYRDALGMSLPSDVMQRHTGVKWISIVNDTLSAIAYYRKKQLTAREWLASLSGVKAFAVFSLRDPKPFIFQPFNYLRNYLGRPEPGPDKRRPDRA